MRREEFGLENLVKALNHMKGTLLICDRNRNVVYYNDVVCSALDIPEERLSGANLMGLAEEGYILNSASIQAFETRQLSIKYVRGKMKMPILTVSNPVLDENGEVALVVAVSFNEQITELVAREMMESRQKSIELLDFLSSKMSNNATVIAESAAMKGILAFLTRISPADSNILLTGETGAGKEVLAKYIHNQSSRSGGVFIPVNCAAIPESLMESEFFGYARGAFTGANKEGKAGVFELADGGTIFLDEIGEIDAGTQVRLLRVLSERTIERVGSNTPIPVNVRIIAATNKSLKKLVQEGKFREDLYFRLNVVHIQMPPLRDRREDVPLLATAFLKEFARENNKEFKPLSRDALDAVRNYSWPGNVRELRTAMEHGVVMSNSASIELSHLPPRLHAPQQPAAPGSMAQEQLEDNAPSTQNGLVPAGVLNLSLLERNAIQQALARSNGNRTAAAHLLGISRRTLQRKLQDIQPS